MPDKNPMSSQSRFKRLKDAYLEKKRLEFAKKANANPASYSMTEEEKQSAMRGLKKIVRTEGLKPTGKQNSVGYGQTWIPENNKPLARRKR